MLAGLGQVGCRAQGLVCEPAEFVSRLSEAGDDSDAMVFIWSHRLREALVHPLIGREVPIVVVDRIWRQDGADEVYALGVTRYLSFREISLLPTVLKDIRSRGSRSHSETVRRREMEKVAMEIAETELRTQLSFSVLHDVANVLSGIEGKLRMISSEAGASLPDLRDLEKNCSRAVDLIKSSLLLSAGKSSSESSGEILGQIGSLFRSVLPAEVHFDEQISLPSVVLRIGEPELLQTVLNLLFNARDAVVQRARFEGEHYAPFVRLEGNIDAGSNDVLISVVDNGNGIPAEVLPLVFEPGFTTKAEGEGSGLGLFSVRQVVERSGGTLQLQTSTEGTTFTIQLPCVVQCPAQEPAEVRPSIGGATVLLVEDNETIAAVLEESFRALGYELLLAQDSISALRLLTERRQPVQLVVSDYSMPGPSGLELRSAVNAQWPETKFILCSGYAVPTDDAELHLVRKPFHLEELVEKVQEVLSKN